MSSEDTLNGLTEQTVSYVVKNSTSGGEEVEETVVVMSDVLEITSATRRRRDEESGVRRRGLASYAGVKKVLFVKATDVNG